MGRGGRRRGVEVGGVWMWSTGFVVRVRTFGSSVSGVDEVVAGSQVVHDWCRMSQVKIE